MRSTWGRKGETPIIRSTGSWKNISATGIIATDAYMKKVRELCVFTKGAVHKEDTVKTLRHLLQHIKGSVALFWDGLAQHKAGIVRDFLNRHHHRFCMVERFPAYAPELNPQEYVWASSKTKDLANYCPQKPGDLGQRAKKSIHRIQQRPNLLRGALKKSGLF